MKVSVGFDPRDIWIGIFWKCRRSFFVRPPRRTLHIYICLIPMFPIHLQLGP